jgi:hypothetical protein
VEMVKDIIANRVSIDSYSQSIIYGLALRSLMKEALNKHQTIETFIPEAAAAWFAMTDLNKAYISYRTAQSGSDVDYRKDPRHSIFIFGSVDDKSFQELYEIADRHLFGRPHRAEMYKDMLTRNSKPGDTIIVLLSLDSDKRVPAEYSYLLPQPWPDVEKKLKQGQVVNEQGKAREMSIFLIAAPTYNQMLDEFKRMVAERKF